MENRLLKARSDIAGKKWLTYLTYVTVRDAASYLMYRA
jgi:hypothetical protein